MKIIFVTTCSLELEGAVRNRLNSFIQVGLSESFNIQLYSSDSDGYILLNHDNFQHHCLGLNNAKGVSFFKRGAKELLLAKEVLSKVECQANDWVIISIPSMFLLFLSGMIRSQNIVLDIRDLSWEYLSFQKLSHRIVIKLFRFLAKRSLKKIRKIIVSNERQHQIVAKMLISSKEESVSCGVYLIPNGISKIQFSILSNIIQPQFNSKMNVAYVGNVGLAQNLTTLIKAAKRLPHVNFQIVGNGSDFENLKSTMHKYELKNVQLFGRLPWSKLSNIYNNTDILYAQLTNGYDTAVPSKLYEYLATGKYIIFGGEGAAVCMLREFSHCSIIDADSVEQIVSTICALEKTKEYQSLSNTNKKLIKAKFIRDNQVEIFYESLHSIH